MSAWNGKAGATHRQQKSKRANSHRNQEMRLLQGSKKYGFQRNLTTGPPHENLRDAFVTRKRDLAEVQAVE
jgi:hypothetical protein